MREAGFVKSEASLVEREVRFMKREAEGSLVVPDLVVRCLLPDRRSDRSLALAALIGYLWWYLCLRLIAYDLLLPASACRRRRGSRRSWRGR